MIQIKTPAKEDFRKICIIDKEIFKKDHDKNSVIIDRLKTFPEGCFLALDNDKEVGYLSSEIWSREHTIASNVKASKNHDPKGRILYISGIGILPNYQNKKIGSRLLKKAITLAKKMMAKYIILRTHTERSKRFYEKHGFKQISYKNLEPEDKCYIMKLNLENG